MKARSALSIQRDVIFALFVREMNARFSSYTFGNVWLVLEPLMMMVMYILLFGLRGRGEFGFVEPPIFVFAAFLPFRLLWNGTMRKAAGIVGGSRGLTGFRQVRLFDVFLARMTLEGGLFLLVGIVLGTLLLWAGFDPVPRDPLLLIGYCTLLWLFAGGFGLLFCLIGRVAREVEKILNMATMPLLFISAVFFPMSIVPARYREILAWNPLVHAMELIREAWFANYTSPVADVSYLFYWTICTLALAIAGYRLMWQRIVAS